jgi:hypothetical protein
VTAKVCELHLHIVRLQVNNFVFFDVAFLVWAYDEVYTGQRRVVFYCLVDLGVVFIACQDRLAQALGTRDIINDMIVAVLAYVFQLFVRAVVYKHHILADLTEHHFVCILFYV